MREKDRLLLSLFYEACCSQAGNAVLRLEHVHGLSGGRRRCQSKTEGLLQGLKYI